MAPLNWCKITIDGDDLKEIQEIEQRVVDLRSREGRMPQRRWLISRELLYKLSRKFFVKRNKKEKGSSVPLQVDEHLVLSWVCQVICSGSKCGRLGYIRFVKGEKQSTILRRCSKVVHGARQQIWQSPFYRGRRC